MRRKNPHLTDVGPARVKPLTRAQSAASGLPGAVPLGSAYIRPPGLCLYDRTKSLVPPDAAGAGLRFGPEGHGCPQRPPVSVGIPCHAVPAPVTC